MSNNRLDSRIGMTRATLTVLGGLGLSACDPHFWRTGVESTPMPTEAVAAALCGDSPGQTPAKEALAEDKLLDTVPTEDASRPHWLAKPFKATWTSSHSLVVAGERLHVVDRANEVLVTLDSATLTQTAVVPLKGRPERMIAAPNGVLYVTLRQGAGIARVDPNGTTVLEVIPVGVEPTAVALDADRKLLYVATAGRNEIFAISTETHTVVGTATVDARPMALVAMPSGHVVVGHQSADAQLLWFAKSGFKLMRSTPLRTSPGFDQLGDTGRRGTRVAAGTLNPHDDSVLLTHLVVNPGTPEQHELLSGLTTTAAPSGGYGATGTTDPCFDPPPRPAEIALTPVSVFSDAAPVDVTPVVKGPSGRAFLTEFDQPSDIVAHPTLAMVAVAAMGTDNVLLMSVIGRSGPVGWIDGLGEAPAGVAFSHDGRVAYVLNAHSFTISEVDLEPVRQSADATDIGEGDPSLVHLTAQRHVTFGTDPLPETARLGRRTFFNANNPRLSKAGRLACATCHFEGNEDKQVWIVPAGERQTPALAGRLAGTAPFNWGGTETELKGNMAETINRMGGHGLTPDELGSLEEFLLVGLEPPPNPHRAAEGLTPEQVRGKALFEDPIVGCSGCHRPLQAFTDGLRHDVGTTTTLEQVIEAENASKEKRAPRKGVPLNTPSLVGLHHTAPYLHDGSAATLWDVLDRTDRSMGSTQSLTESQKADLISYLLTL